MIPRVFGFLLSSSSPQLLLDDGPVVTRKEVLLTGCRLGYAVGDAFFVHNEDYNPD
jgi:hypothetical protein